ncbi:MAG: AsmA family protein [Reyranella sp.]
MQKRTWIRAGVALAAVSAFLVVAGLAAPTLLNIDQYKPAMIAAVKEATGRELVIEGPLKLTVFPTLRISARQVRFANAVGAKGAQMVDVRWVGIRPSFWALLQGRIEVGRLTLFRPTLVLEADAQGRPNWEFHPGAGAAQPAGAPSSGLHLAIGTLKIREGTLSYTNPATGQTLKAENLEALASVGSLQGPFDFDATATVNGVPLSLMAKVGAPTDKGSDVSFKLKVQSGTLNFDGHVSRIAPDADVKGKVSLATGGLAEFIASLMRAGGQQMPAFDAAAIGSFAFDGDIDLSAEKLSLTDFRMAIGTESVSGSVTLVTGANPSLESRLSLPTVDAEKWLALLSRPEAFRPKAVEGSPRAAPAAPAKPAAVPARASLSPFPPEFTVLLSIDAQEVTYRNRAARDVGLAVEIRNGVIAVPHLSAILPGDMVLKANAAATPPAPAAPVPKPEATPAVQSAGQFSLTGPRLRETLAWLAIDTSGVPAGKLQTVTIEGKVASTANSLQISDLTMALDGQRATGGGSITFGVPLTVATSVQLESFDLDAYLPESRESVVANPAESTAPAPAPAVAPAVPDKTLPVLGLKAKIDKLAFRGGTLKGIEADLSVQGNLLKVNAFKVADILGARFDLKGQVADFGTAPRFDLTFNAAMPDTDKLLVYAGMPKFLNGKLGASTAGGSVAGTMEALTLRNASVNAAGATARATGSLVLGDKFAFDLSNFALQAQDASGLVSVAIGKAQAGLGGLAVQGAFRGNDQRASFEGSLTAIGTQMSGRIDATLGARPNIAANLRIPGTLNFDDWLGVTDGPAPSVPTPALPAAPGGANAAAVPLPSRASRVVPDKQIDLSALRAFDATLNLETSAIEVGALRVSYADLNATLRNGVFKVAKLTGQFYSGAVDFAGTVDASKNTMTVDVAGTLQGIYVGELLRGAAGQNVFGNEHLKVAVDGKINVMRISLQGQGNSPGQIRDSLMGQGHLSGVIYPSVAGGSLGFASFATGIGSLFSTEMGFNSAVISGFINAQSTIEGDITLSNGEINLRNHALKGPNATARINSRTSLAGATTETTIALDAGSNGATDYVMTVNGPVSAPTMSIRGR